MMPTEPSQALPEPPESLREPGRVLWADVVARYELEAHETALLVELARTADLLDELAARVAEDGPMADGKLHPAVVEARQQRIAFARLVAALRLPQGEEDQGEIRRPQRRVGARGVYQIRPSA